MEIISIGLKKRMDFSRSNMRLASSKRRQAQAMECDNGMWRWVWKVKVSQRVKVFIWLALHDMLMTNTVRVRRDLASDPICMVYGNGCETVDHVLRSCTNAKLVWRELGRQHLHCLYPGTPLNEWIGGTSWEATLMQAGLLNFLLLSGIFGNGGILIVSAKLPRYRRMKEAF